MDNNSDYQKEFIKSTVNLREAFKLNGVFTDGLKFRCINPAHPDRSPSLSVKDKDNFFNCFSCGFAGDVFTLYQTLYNLSFPDAKIKVCEDFNIPCERTLSSSGTEKIKISVSDNYEPIKEKELEETEFLCSYDFYLFNERLAMQDGNGLSEEQNEFIAKKYIRAERIKRNVIIFNELFDFCNTQGLPYDVKNYLTNIRKFPIEFIKEKKIFSIGDYHSTNKFLKSKFDIEELRGAGLIHKEGKNLSISSDYRIQFSYLDDDNNIYYIRNRFFNAEGNPDHKTKEKAGKYKSLWKDKTLNINYVKRFFNERIINSLPSYENLLITEGEIDGLTAELIGYNSISIAGTGNIPMDKIEKLLNYEITLCLDMDLAGNEAGQELQSLFNSYGKTVSIMNIPKPFKDLNEFYVNRSSKLNAISNTN